MWSHVSLGQEGNRVPRTGWARVLWSEPFTLAVADEVIGCARRAGHILDFLADVPGQFQGLSGSELRSARDLMLTVANADRRAGHGDYDMVNRRELLRATPLSRPPSRVPPASRESDTDLCTGIADSARRLGAVAYTASQLPGETPGLSWDAWRKSARSSAVISDLARDLTGMLADRASSLEISPTSESALRDASEAFMNACSAWQQVATMWRPLRTDTQFPSSPPLVEQSDIALRLGRLLYGKPDWIPKARGRSVLRKPSSLAPGKPELVRPLAAVHETANALVRLAVADLKSIQAADEAGRLYVPNEAVLGPTANFRYVRISGHQVHMLMNAYHIGIQASMDATNALDAAALATGSPSKILSLARAATTDGSPVPEPGYELDPEVFARHRLPYFERPLSHLRPYEQLDANEVVRAYTDAGLSVRQCAERFIATKSVIASILAFNGFRPRNGGGRWPADETYERTEPDGADRPETREEPPPGLNMEAPVTSRLGEMGIADPAIRLRAAAIDNAAATLLHRASYRSAPVTPQAPRRKRTAAELAALDGSTTATGPRQGPPPVQDNAIPRASTSPDPHRPHNRSA